MHGERIRIPPMHGAQVWGHVVAEPQGDELIGVRDCIMTACVLKWALVRCGASREMSDIVMQAQINEDVTLCSHCLRAKENRTKEEDTHK